MVTDTKFRQVEPDITVVEIAGRLTLGNALQSLEASLQKAIDEGARKLVIDVAAVNYLDSAAIGMLVGCNGYMEQKGGRVRIAGAQGPIAKVFAIAHLDRILPLDADVPSACESLSQGSAAV